MIFKGSARDSLNTYGGKSKRKNNVRKSYAQFFEGYAEYAIPRKNGRGSKIVRVYVADYYSQNLSNHLRVLIKLLYTVMYLIMTVLFINASIKPMAGNTVWYVNIPQAFCIFFLGWMLVSFKVYLPAKKLMTMYTYRKSTFMLSRSSLGAAISFGVLALMSGLYNLVNIHFVTLQELGNAACYLIGCAIAVVIYLIEKKIIYSKVLNNTTVPDNSYLHKN